MNLRVKRLVAVHITFHYFTIDFKCDIILSLSKLKSNHTILHDKQDYLSCNFINSEFSCKKITYLYRYRIYHYLMSSLQNLINKNGIHFTLGTTKTVFNVIMYRT